MKTFILVFILGLIILSSIWFNIGRTYERLGWTMHYSECDEFNNKIDFYKCLAEKSR